MSAPFDISKFVYDLARAMIDDILDSDSPEEINQLIEELELRLWKSRLH
jgi:hypothetical protein